MSTPEAALTQLSENEPDTKGQWRMAVSFPRFDGHLR